MGNILQTVTSSLSLKAGASTTPLVSRPAIGSQVRSRFRKLAGFEAPHTDNLSHSHDGTTPSRREDGASPKVGDTFKSVHPNSMLHCWSGDRHKQLSHNPHISVIGFHPHPEGWGFPAEQVKNSSALERRLNRRRRK